MNIIGLGHVVVQNNGSTPYINMSAPSAGMVRWNGNNNCLEIYDGNSWIMQTAGAYVDLSPSAKAAVDWATKKMAEEEKLDKLCKEFPGLQKARDNFEMFKRLVENEIDSARV